MEIIGLVAEYNPFHNGHLYQINKIKEKYPESIIIVILNGYFSQRGELSIISKEDKTRICLENGIDIVIELPFIYGTQASDIFAFNSIKLLNELKINRLIFGSESDDISLLNKIVDIQLYDEEYEEMVHEYMDQGYNYPTAMAKALNIDFDFSNPNDLLGISYIKAIRKINSDIKVETIKRTSDYHGSESDSEIISASNIRDKIKNNKAIDKYVPNGILERIIDIDYRNIFTLLKFKLLTDKDLSVYLDVDEGIEYRIMKYVNQSNNWEELVNNIKTKRYTYNKINRMLIHILIGLTKEDNLNTKLDYLKILGFNTSGRDYLNSIKKDMELSLNKDSIIYKYELLASSIYKEITKIDCYSFDLSNRPIQKD